MYLLLTHRKNQHKVNHTLLVVLLSLTFILPAYSDETTSVKPLLKNKLTKIKKINDLRIIVDISGSMKKTDPNNLRRPAIRLLAGLIPEGSRSGIWNFGKQVNMTVKIGIVNKQWRELARQQSKNINSVGLYTNIESAMRKVSFDWKTPNPRYKRNLILLTDGHVDVSKNEKLDKASRKKILKEVLPALEKANVRIHTIALSDDVDESLLTTLSAYTDGLYKKVDSADDLQKLFLQMLEQSVDLDTLPIKDNTFSVDESINDMTLLVFNKDKKNATIVITPKNEKWSKQEHTKKVKWFSDEGYDLITIKKPEKGEWRIKAPNDPNNRVVVATNLKLKMNELPSYIVTGNTMNLAVHLEEDDKPLTDKRLMSKFSFMLISDVENKHLLKKMESDEYSYHIKLEDKFEEGNHEFIIQAKSPTAEREIRHQFKVYSTLADINISDAKGKYEVSVEPRLNILRPDSIKINIELKDKSVHKLKSIDNKWLLVVDKKYKESLFKINIEGLGADGKPLSMSFNKTLIIEKEIQKLDLADKFKKQEEKVKEQNKISSEDKKPLKKELAVKEESEKLEAEKKEGKKEEEKKETTANWTVIISAVVGGNIFLVLLVGGGYIYMKRRKENMAKKLEEEMHEGTEKKESTKDENK